MNTFKLALLICASFLSISAMAQPIVIGGDNTGRSMRDHQDQRRSLIDSFRNSRDSRVNLGNDSSGVTFLGGDAASGRSNTGGTIIGGDGTRDSSSRDFQGGTHTGPNNQRLIDDEGQPIQIHSLQQALGRRTNDPAGVAAIPQKQKAPMRLYFDQIHFESDEVSEVTLKDGTVVTTQELQEFAKEVILKKLNEQK